MLKIVHYRVLWLVDLTTSLVRIGARKANIVVPNGGAWFIFCRYRDVRRWKFRFRLANAALLADQSEAVKNGAVKCACAKQEVCV